MSKVVEVATKLALQPSAECDVEVIEVEYKKTVNGMELIFFIDTDREGGISLNDCEKFHNLIDPLLDAQDPTDGAPYRLSVSSPGLDRALKAERDYKKNMGKLVNVSLYEKGEFGKKFVATLTAYDLVKGVVTLDIKGAIHEFELQTIAIIKPEIVF